MTANVNGAMGIGGSTESAKRLRIAVLNRIFRPTGGGAERYSIALVEQLAARHDIHVFTQQIDHHWPGVTYHRIPEPFNKPRWINQLWYAVATWWATRRGFDVIHSHENTWHGQVQTVHVLPVKFSLFDGRSGWRFALRWLKVATSPRLLTYLLLEHFRYAPRDGRCVIATSSSLQAIMAETYPQVRSLMKVVTPGVKQVSEPVGMDERRAARMLLNLPERGRCILFVGNDYRKKGLATLIAALRYLPDDTYLAVVGNASQISGFRDEVAASAAAQRIFFLGALDDVSNAYRAADCLAHPTLEDTFAMVVLEAMAHGLPVVVSGPKYCGIAGLLSHEVNAILLKDPRDPQALGQALLQVLSDALLQRRLREAGQHFARSHLWTEVARQQEKIYLAVADRGLSLSCNGNQ
ncbi:MAG: glycosyltransferase family 4 protein [Rhodoferax sp.]